MNRITAALLALFCILGGCAEGGSRGSGISTAVEGNVASVQIASLPPAPRGATPTRLGTLHDLLAVEGVARAGTDLEGIEVSLEGTAFQAPTDAEGRFSLHGNFEGDATLVFQRPAGNLLARLPINVPAAGTLTLTNVHIDAAQGEASPESQSAQFEGVITAIDCGASTMSMRSVQQSPTDLDLYTIRLDTSVVRDSRGNVLSCSDLQNGQQALVQAQVNTDGSFGNGTVELLD